MNKLSNLAAPLAALFMTSGCATTYGGSSVTAPPIPKSIAAAGHETETEIDALVGRLHSAGFKIESDSKTSVGNANFDESALFKAIEKGVSDAIPNSPDNCPKGTVTTFVWTEVRDRLRGQPNTFLSGSWWSLAAACHGDKKTKVENYKTSLENASGALRHMSFQLGK